MVGRSNLFILLCNNNGSNVIIFINLIVCYETHSRRAGSHETTGSTSVLVSEAEFGLLAFPIIALFSRIVSHIFHLQKIIK